MLVLSRKINETIHIGDDITITVVQVDRNKVRIGIQAPDDVRIMRGELIDWLGDGIELQSDSPTVVPKPEEAPTHFQPAR